ncbi:MAG TPA: trypsin-like peptidase domain-containing protein [Gaiellales bacterium]|nr:trypsin-like peptidase domain-containing protein [Gaiellales bacterium]
MKRTTQAAALIAAATLGAGTAVTAVVLTGESGDSPGTTTTIVGSASPAASTTTPMSAAEIYRSTVAGVVEIKVSSTSSTPGPFGQQSQVAEGTGFEIDSKGDIATNAHVVADATSISVETNDGATHKATLVGSDATTDVAVIHIDAAASSLHPLTFGDSTALAVGDPVVAIGDPFGLANSVSAGIVSALGRTITSPDNHPIQDAIQTDAALNHGNSGGPLFNDQGEVIGVTSQIYADQSTSGGNVGIGFAVPSATVERIARELISSGHASHPYLGVSMVDAQNGARIARVEAGSPAADAGLKAGDVITAIDGRSVSSSDDVVQRVSAMSPGDSVTLTVQRGSSSTTIHATLGNRG